MTRRSQNLSLLTLRADAARFLCLCIMVLALPIVHPLAEARAAQNGLSQIICTQFGVVAGAGETIPVGAADDCPCIVLCGGMVGGKFLKALAPASAVSLSIPLRSSLIVPADRQVALHSHLSAHARGIRGPPYLI